MSGEEARSDSADHDEHSEVFAEISLFDAEMTGSEENGDCGCFSCDGSPCVK